MRDVVRALAAVALAYVAMGLVAAAGLRLIGAGSPVGLLVATAAMAVGGAADLAGVSARTAQFGASVHGAIHVLPLGVSLTGALVLAALLRRHAASVRALVTTLIAAPLAFALPALAGHGRLAIAAPCAHRAYGLGGCQGGRPALGGIRLDYHTDVWRTAFGGLAWTLVVLALLVLASRDVRLPDGLAWVRPAVVASVTVTLWAALTAVVAGLLLAVGGGPKVAGAALLLGPNVAFAALPAGIGVPWSAGPHGGWSGTALGHAWPVVVLFAAAVLLTIGVLTAARTPVPDRSAWRRRLTRAGRSALTTGTLVAGMTAVAGVSAGLSVSVLGLVFPVVVLRAAGDILVALVLGSAAGAVAGLAGGVLLEVFGPRVPVWRRRRTW
jgi:hypothetical protein